MWDQYKKNFWGMQALIASVAVGVVAFSHMLAPGALFFVVMQVGGVLGAMWAKRLKDKFEAGDPARLRRT
jgi:hypothetical protein